MQSTLDIQKKIAENENVTLGSNKEEVKEAPKKEEKKVEPNPHLRSAFKILEDAKMLTEERNVLLNVYEKESHPIEPYLIAKGLVTLNEKEILTPESSEFIFAHPKEAADFANVMVLLYENREKGLFDVLNQNLIKQHVSELYYINLALRYLAGKKINVKDSEDMNILTQYNFDLIMQNISYKEEFLVDAPEVKSKPALIVKQEASEVKEIKAEPMTAPLTDQIAPSELQTPVTEIKEERAEEIARVLPVEESKNISEVAPKEPVKKQIVQIKEVSNIAQICTVLHELRAAGMLEDENFKRIMLQAKDAGPLAVLMNLGMTHRGDLNLFLRYLDNPTRELQQEVINLLLKVETLETLADHFSEETIDEYRKMQANVNGIPESPRNIPEIEEESAEVESPRMKRG